MPASLIHAYIVDKFKSVNHGLALERKKERKNCFDVFSVICVWVNVLVFVWERKKERKKEEFIKSVCVGLCVCVCARAREYTDI